MTRNKTKAEILQELEQAQKRIAELEFLTSQPAQAQKVDVSHEDVDEFGRVRTYDEGFFTWIFNASPAQMAITDTNTSQYVAVNESFLRVLGFEREEVVGKTPLELGLFQDMAQRTELLARLKEQGFLRNEDVLVRTKSGDVLHGVFYAEYIHVQHRKYLLTLMNDVTERVKAETKLHQSESQYRALIESLDVSLCRWLPDSTLTFANERYRNIFGVKGQAAGQKWFNFLPESTRAGTVAFYEELIANPRTVTYEHPVTIEDGRVRQFQWIDTPIYNIEGELVEFQSVGFDITERKLAEDAVRESEKRLRGFLDSAPDSTIISNASGRIILANQQTEKMFGYSMEELQGMDVEDLIPEHMRLMHVNGRADFMESPRRMVAGSTNELLVLHKDGHLFPAEISLSHHVLADGESVALASIRDVTERKYSEMLIAAQRDLARLVTEDMSMEQVWDACFKIAMRATDLDCGGIYVFDTDTRAFNLVHHHGLGADFIARVREIPEESPSAKLMLAGKTMFFSQADLHTQGHHQKEGLRSLAAVPIHYGDNILGCINVASHKKDEVPEFSRNTLNIIAVEIANILIYQRAKEDLHKNESLLAEAQRIGRIGHWEWTAGAGNLIGSDQLFRIFGLQPGDHKITLHSLATLLDPGGEGTLRALDHAIVANHEDMDYEFPIHLPDGDDRWLHQYAKITYGEDGKPTRMLGTIQDITERKRNENDLKEARERLVEAQELAHIGHWEWDLKLQQLIWSDEVYKIFGVTPESFTPTTESFEATIHPDDKESFLKERERMLAEKQYASIDHRIVLPNGEIRHVQERTQLLLDSEGKINRVIGTVQDITERVLVENALRRSQSKLRQALVAARMGEWRFDIATRSVEWSEESMQLFKIKTNIVSFETLLNYFHRDDRVIGERYLRSALENGRLGSEEFRIIDSTGKLIWVTGFGHASYDENGNLIEISGLIQDVTERKKAELELQRSTQMLEQAQSIAHLGNWELAPREGRGIFWSSEMFRMFHMDSKAGVPDLEKFMQLVHPNDRQTLLDAEKQAFETGQDVISEYRAIIDGETRYFQVTIRAQTDSQGQLVHSSGTVLDITEIRKAFQQLTESESKYRLLAENISDVIWILDLEESRFTYVSPSVLLLRGYSAEEVQVQKLEDAISPDSARYLAAKLPERIEAYLQGDTSSYIDEIEQPCKDGSSVWTETMTRILRNPDTGHLETYGVSRNITERRQAEEAIRTIERRNTALIEHAPDGIAVVDAEGKFIFASPSAYRIFDYGLQNIIGQDSRSLVCPDDLPVLDDIRLRLAQQPDQTHTGTYRFMHRDGSYRWIESTYTNMFGESSVRGVVINFRDVTERKLAVEELHRMEMRYRALVENAPSGVALLSPEGRFSYASTSALKILGYQAEDLFSGDPNALTHPDDLAMVLNELPSLVQDPSRVPTLQYRFRHKRGDWRWLESTFSNMLSVPSVEAIVINFHDITERKQAEEALRAEQLRFAKVADTIPGAVCTFQLSPTGQLFIPYASKAFEEIYGITLAEVAENINIITNRVPSAQVLSLRNSITESVKTMQPWRNEYQYEHPQKGLIWIEGYSMPVREEDGSYLWHGVAQDITERKKLEAAVRRNESLLLEAQRIGRIGHMEWNGYDEGLICSDELYDILGLPRQSHITQQTISSMMQPEERQALLEKDMQIIQQRANIDYEYRIFLPDGSERWLHQMGRITYSDKGVPIRMMAVIQDVTAQTLADAKIRENEEYLRESEARARAMLQAIPDMMFRLDKDGVFLDYKADINELYAQDTPSLIGKKNRDVSAVEFADLIENKIKLTLESGKLQTFEYEMEIPRLGMRSYEARMAPSGSGEVLAVVRDISERKTSEQALRASEEFYRLVSAINADYVFSTEIDEKGNLDLKWVGGGFEAMTGYTFEEYKAMGGWRAALHPDDREQDEADLVALMENEKISSALRTIHKDGEVRWAQVYANPVWSEAKERLIGIYGTVQDITERKRAEDALHLRVSELEMLYDTGLAFSQILSPSQIGQKIIETLEQKMAWHHIIIRLYDSERDALKVLAYSVGSNEGDENFMGRASSLNKGLSGWSAKHIEVIRSGDVMSDERYIETFPGMRSGLYVPMVSGRLMLGVITIESGIKNAFTEADERFVVTLANQAAVAIENARLNNDLEERVRQRTAEVQDLYDNAPIGYHSLDEDGNILLVNQTHLTWLGYSREEVVGHSFAEFLTPLSAKNFQKEFPNFKRVGNVRDLEFELLCKDGRVIPVLISATAIYNEDGNYVMSRTTLFDNTEQKEADEVMRTANFELARAMRMKDEFLASMSHELRTPLTGILGLSEAIQLGVYGVFNEKMNHAIENIQSSGRHLLELINDILDVSKIEAGKLELQISPFSLGDICKSGLQLTKGLASKKRQNVSFSMSPEQISMVGDPRRLKQVVVNLLSNAIKYTPEEGEVGLEVTANEAEKLVYISVWDKGMGISHEDLGKLFQPFVQLDSSLSRQQTGTGLGLVLVKRLVELHEGSLNVESEPGEGSRFTVILPYVPTAFAEQHKIPDKVETQNLPPAPAAIATVMIVDDNELGVATLTDFLTQQNFRVVSAGTGREFLSKLPQTRPDIILMDIQMPGMDGLETIRRLRAQLDKQIAGTPVIAITALAMPGDRERCIEAGADDYLSKPFRLLEIRELIEKIIKETR